MPDLWSQIIRRHQLTPDRQQDDCLQLIVSKSHMSRFCGNGWLWLVHILLMMKIIDASWRHYGRQLNDIKGVEDTLRTLSIQLMAQQFYVEEQTRANGNSGLKQVRSVRHGARPYYAASHVATSVASVHDHANNDRTIGMGEMIAVLNGIEFRTRHNDYRLKMKSKSSTEYGAVDNIEFPEVPPEVTQITDLKKQVEEMALWFKAWKDQDYSVRDYRPYFKPVLCYLEGSWTHSEPDTIDEPFDSDRHHFDATSWYDLQQKIRFTSYSGGKDNLENFGYLPTTVMKLVNGTRPVLGQWNYDILCHPLSKDLPLDHLHPVDDLKARMSHGAMSMEEYLSSRAARFRIGEPVERKSTKWDILDEIMGEVPGRDNYPGDIVEDIFGDITLPYNTTNKVPLNVAYYHRTYRVSSAGAMGLKTRHRGFSDEALFAAQTTQTKVISLEVESCPKDSDQCTAWEQRWSYAIPLEIIYTTPLANWNPYNILYRGDSRSTEGKQIFDGPHGRRTGKSEKDKAYDGTNSKVFYRTPYDFFEEAGGRDPADTAKSSVYILDSKKNVRLVRASGHRIIIPNIPGVGSIRQRYPIMPIYGEGGGVWKELEALKDIVLEPSKYRQMFRDSPALADVKQVFITDPSKPQYGSHKHHFTLDGTQLATLDNGGVVSDVVTEEVDGHTHTLTLVKTNKTRYMMQTCDGKEKCFDGHSKRVYPV